MPMIVQACTLSGRIIETARWELSFPAVVQEGHQIDVSIPFNDEALSKYISKVSEHMLDKIGDDYSVTLSFKVTHIRHMVDIFKDTTETNSLAFIYPTNNMMENIILYLLEPSNSKFADKIKGEAT
jgi:hypothetical protein